MPKQNVSIHAFNRGLISPLALARTDLDRTGLSAETFTNWMPRNLGSMMLRPGTSYIGSTKSNLQTKFIPFVFSNSDTALLELTNTTMRVWRNDALISRVSVSTSITNGNFTSDLASWTDNDEAGATSVWVTGGYMGLTGNGSAAAIREQQVSVSATDLNKEHALQIVIERGPVTLRVGSTSGDDNYISETSLDTGYHSLSFIPAGLTVYIEFSSRLKRQVLVDSCNIESSGTMEVTTPWITADLSKIRYDQSADIIYIAADGYQQYKIERRSTTSWSVVKYYVNDGPFRGINISPTTISASAISGNVTLTASNPLFTSTNVGSLYRITSTGQTVTASVTAEDTFTNSIRVTGVSSSRVFTIIRSGTWVATVTLQRSLTSSTGPWEDVTTYTTNATITYDDTLDNQIAWYRIGVKTGDFTSGTVELTLDYAIGSIDGIARITDYTSSTSVGAEVIVDLGGTDATDDWYEGEWSDRRGFPTSVAFVEGRLGWAGQNKVWLSISDGYSSFDDTVEGDSGVIVRTIGSGPVDNINWMVAVRRLLLGGDGAEYSCRSSNDDEPLTPTNANLKSFTTQGSADIQALKIDKSAVFVQKGGTRIMEAFYGEDFDYSSNDLTNFYPEAGDSPFTHIAVQRQPDTRIHCARSDGKVSILIHDTSENVTCWLLYETDGSVEDIVILPGGTGTVEDSVYYIINRTINGSTVRYLEKWALESQCQGGTTNRQLDSHVIYTGPSLMLTGLDHLEGKTVAAWGSGKDLGTYTVSSGSITLSESVNDPCAGLPYTAQWKSSKLSYAAGLGTALTQKKKISTLGVILYNTYYQGLKYGPDFNDLDDLPLVKDGKETVSGTVYSSYDEEAFTFPGNWDADSRLCLQAASPNPCTILAAIIGIETHDRY